MNAYRLAATLLLATLMPVAGCFRHCAPPEFAKSNKLTDLNAPPDSHAPISPGLIRDVEAAFKAKGAGRHPAGARPYQFLALSGGGLFGSYGVGVLCGWTESGTRPEFDVVTGISTGAIISTFAFLGPKYDAFLRDTVIDTAQKDIVRRLPLVAIPVLDSLYSSRPLEKSIEEQISDKLLCEVAQAHAKGRRLYVGTTSLDTRKLIIWDMGAIASQGTQEAYALYRKIILASSSIPGAFPAVKLPLEIDGIMYDELHVDGGVSDEVIFRGFMVGDLNRANGGTGAWAPPGSRLHVIVNGKLYSDPECVRRQLRKIVSVAAKSVLYGKGRDELYRIYLNCLETGVDFRLTAIPQGLPVKSGSLGLSREERQSLFDAGVKDGRQAATGDGWRDLPPGSDATEQSLPRAGTRFLSNGPAAGVTPDRGGNGADGLVVPVVIPGGNMLPLPGLPGGVK